MAADLNSEANLRRELLSLSQVLFSAQQEANVNSVPAQQQMQSLLALLQRGTRLLRAILALAQTLQHRPKGEVQVGKARSRRLLLHSISEEYRAWIDRFIFVYRQVSAQEERNILAGDPSSSSQEASSSPSSSSSTTGPPSEPVELAPITTRLLASNREALLAVETSLQNASTAVLRAMVALKGHSVKSGRHAEVDGHHHHQHGHSKADLELGGAEDDDQRLDTTKGMWICLVLVILFTIAEFIWR